MNISQALRIVLDLAQENALDEREHRNEPRLAAEAKKQADAIMLVEQMVKRGGAGGVK